MKVKALLILLLVGLKNFAQPTISTSVLPVKGDITQLNIDTNWIDPGNGGANQSWNFNGLPAHYSPKRFYVDPATTSYTSLFTNATLCRKDSSGLLYAYFNNSGTVSNYFGFVQPGIVDQSYAPNPIHYYKFPINYLDNYTDTFTATTNPGSLVGHGKYYFTADGYGSLGINGKLFQNTLRTHSTIYIGDSTVNSYSLTHEYSWYQEGQKEPALVITKVIVNGTVTNKSTLWKPSFTGINEIDPLQIAVFPNPAHDYIIITSSEGNSEWATLWMYNISGENCLTRKIKFGEPIDLSGFQSGYYFLQLITPNNSIRHKLIIH